MSSKKKPTKMPLADFLADQATGSWADEMDDLPSAPAAAFSDYGDHEKGGFGDSRRSGFPDRRTYSRDSRYESRESPRESRFSSRSERSPQELPTSPPYTAHLGNLPFDLTEEQVKKFFFESKILTIRILRDKESRPKGFGYVEFEDLESLTKALQLSGENLGKRTVRISVADPPREREDRTAGEWRRIMPRESQAPSPRGDRFGGSDKFGHKEDRWGERSSFRDRGDRGERDRGDRFDRMDRSIERNDRGGNDRLERKGDTEWRGGGFNNSRSSSFRERRSEERFGNNHNSVRKNDMRPLPEPNSENSDDTRAVATDTDTSPPVRKKLELKPRSSSVTSNETATPRSSKPNPFGEAKPIDSDEGLRRAEERRKQKEKEQKDQDQDQDQEELEKPDTTVTTENGDS